MKKITFVLIVAFFALSVCKIEARSIPLPPDTTSYCIFPLHKSVIGNFISSEHPTLATHFQIQAKCYFIDKTTIHNLIWELPENWTVISFNTLPLTGNRGDSLLLTFTLSIPDTSSLPFYPKNVYLKVLAGNQDSVTQTVTLESKISVKLCGTVSLC